MAPTDTFRNGEREREQESHLVRQSSKCYEHRESQATAMTVDYTGEWALLAGRRHLSLQRLSQEDGVLRKYATNSKYKVSAAEFAICPASKEACAIAVRSYHTPLSYCLGISKLKLFSLFLIMMIPGCRPVSTLTSSPGEPRIHVTSIRCGHTLAWSPILTGTERIPICWSAAL